MIQGVYNGVTTAELDELAAQTAAYCATQHPDFSLLAARISISNLHKNTTKNFSELVNPGVKAAPSTRVEGAGLRASLPSQRLFPQPASSGHRKVAREAWLRAVRRHELHGDVVW